VKLRSRDAYLRVLARSDIWDSTATDAGKGGDLGPVGAPELGEDVADMSIDGALGDVQLLPDLRWSGLRRSAG